MKNKSKAPLFIALGLVTVGLSFTTVGLIGGGYSQAKELCSSKFSWALNFDNNIFQINTKSDNRFNFASSDKSQSYNADDIKAIVIDSKTSKVSILKSPGDDYEITTDDIGVTSWKLNNDTLYIKSDKVKSDNVTLYIPQDAELESVDLDIGASELYIDTLNTRELDLSLGAGDVIIDHLTSDGRISFEIGAGNCSTNDSHCKDATLEIGMGHLSYAGTIYGDLDLECGLGDAELNLEDYEDNHNYSIETGIGKLTIGDKSFNNIGNNFKTDNQSNSDYDIECGTGNVVVKFEK